MGYRRTMGILGITVLVGGLLVLPARGFADEGQEAATGFIDENGDGIPDGRAAHGTMEATQAAAGWHGMFVDEDGDGVNDLTQDADGDGIVNGMDADYLQAKGITLGRGWMRHAFVDENGDGVNDLAQDSDGDGIPNGMDLDYHLPEGVTVTERGHGVHMGGSIGFLDEDGDGVNDLMQDADGDGVLNGMDPDYALPEGMVLGAVGGQHQMGRSMGAVDVDGDGVNDLVQDADGDGIPNGLDSDYVRSHVMGSGHRVGAGHGMMWGSADLPGEGAAVSPTAGVSEMAQQAADVTGAVTPAQTTDHGGMMGSGASAQGQGTMSGQSGAGSGMQQGAMSGDASGQAGQGTATAGRGRMMGHMRGRPAGTAQDAKESGQQDSKGN